MTGRTVCDVDLDLLAATMRRRSHKDTLSRDANMRAIDVLLDERLALTGRPAVKR